MSAVLVHFEKVISAENFDDQVCLEVEIVFTNRIMAELKNNLKCFNAERFFLFINSVVSLPIYEQLKKVEKKNFQARLGLFENQRKKVQKTQTKYKQFIDNEYAFFAKKKHESSPIKRKRTLSQNVHSLRKSQKLLIEKMLVCKA